MFLFVFAADLVEEVQWLDEALIAFGGLAAALGLPKLAKKLRSLNLRKALKRADNVMGAASALSGKPIDEVIGEAIKSSLAEFSAEQKARDESQWTAHNRCHDEISKSLKKLESNATKNAKAIASINTDISYIKGHLHIGAD